MRNDEIEIGERCFLVLKYAEGPGYRATVHSVLLKVSAEDLEFLRDVLEREPVRVRRPGEDVMVARWGGGMSWSRHHDNTGPYFKQVIRYLSYDAPRPDQSSATRGTLKGSESFALSTFVRFDALVRRLLAKGILSENETEQLLGDAWRDLPAGPGNVPFRWRFEETKDAEELFD